MAGSSKAPARGSAQWWIDYLGTHTPGRSTSHRGAIWDEGTLHEALKPYALRLQQFLTPSLECDGPRIKYSLQQTELRDRIAFGRLIGDLERPDGSIDFQKAKALCGDEFEYALTSLAASPIVTAIPVQSMKTTLGFDAVEVKELVREQRKALSDQIERLQVRRNAYQPPARLPGPNWDAHRKVGRYTDLLRDLQRKDFSHFFEEARSTFTSQEDAKLWSAFERQLRSNAFMSGQLGVLTSELDIDNLPSALASVVLDTAPIAMSERVLALALAQPSRYLSRAEEANWFPLTPKSGEGLASCEKNFIEGLVNEHRRAVQDMPVLTNLVRRLNCPSLFRETKLINHSHLIDTVMPFQKALGLEKSSLFIGKEYSRSAVLLQQLWREGQDVELAINREARPDAQERAQKKDWNKSKFLQNPMASVLTQWIDDHRDEVREGLHIIDDGGEVISELLETFPETTSLCTAVEQTRFGANKLRNKALPLPVANVAECAAKLTLESVLIGWSTSDEVVRQIEDWESLGIPRGKEVVLMGYGAVGRTTALCMCEMGFRVTVVDLSEEARQRAQRDGFATPPRTEALRSADYVLSGTGSCAWTVEDFEALADGAKLFSLSSSVVEFSVNDPRVLLQEPSYSEKLGGYHTFRDQLIPTGPEHISAEHGTRVLTYLDKQFLIANGLHPANFTGAPHAIRSEFIQLTIALLYLGSVVAKSSGPQAKGLISLNEDPLGRAEQLKMAADFMAQLRQMSSTEVPPFILQMAEEAYQQLLEILK